MNHDDVVDLISKELERLSPVWHHKRGLAIARKLLDAGYLVTPAMERAVDACEELSRFPADAYTQPWGNAIRAGISIKAERAAREKPRYYAIPETSGIRVCGCGVMDRHEGNPFYAPGNGFTRKQAEAVAEALNREGGGRG